jgi:hypothetical protein
VGKAVPPVLHQLKLTPGSKKEGNPHSFWKGLLAVALSLSFTGRAAFAGCDSLDAGCPDYGTLRAEVYRLYHLLPGYEMLLDRLLECGGNGQMPPKDIYRRLEDLDTDVQHAGAELIMKELPPCELQRQIDCINRDLRELQALLRARYIQRNKSMQLPN